MRQGCRSVWSERCWNVELETSGHGERAGAEVSCHQGSDLGGQVWPVQREVAGEHLSEALVELSLNASGEGGRHVLLCPCLGS